MKGYNSRSDVPIKKFWDKYIEYIANQGINKQALRWYVLRAEAYIKATSPKKLIQHSPEDVNHYFKVQGRSASLKDWQFCQIVDAIQNLFK